MIRENIRNLFGIITIVLCLYVLSGGFFNGIVKPGNIVEWYGRFYIIDPDISGQTNTESAKAFLCNAATTLGVFVIARNNKSRSPEVTYRVLLLGIALIGFGLIASYYLLEMKRMAVPIG